MPNGNAPSSTYKHYRISYAVNFVDLNMTAYFSIDHVVAFGRHNTDNGDLLLPVWCKRGWGKNVLILTF